MLKESCYFKTMLAYKVKTHTYFHQEKRKEVFAFAFQDSINITHLPLHTQTGHRPRKKKETWMS